MSKTSAALWGRVGLGLLRHLRGRQSQAAFSRSLGFAFNKVSRWENGTLRLTWQDMALVCRHREISLYEILGHLLSATEPLPDDLGLLLRRILGHVDTRSLQTRTKYSRFKFERWMRGESEPEFKDVMVLIAEFTGYHWDVVVEIYAATSGRGLHAEAEALCPELRKVHDILKRREVVALYPESVMIDMYFEVSEYQKLARHEDGFVAKRIGISLARERSLLKAMVGANMLTKKDGKFRSAQLDDNVRTKTRKFDQHADIITYWLQQGARVLDEQRKLGFRPDVSVMSYRCFMVSEKTYQAIQDRVQKFYLEIGSMIRTDPEPPTLPRVMALQVFDPAVRLHTSVSK